MDGFGYKDLLLAANQWKEPKDVQTMLSQIFVPKSIHEDIASFISQMRDIDIRLTDIGITRSKEDILDVYSNMYIIG